MTPKDRGRCYYLCVRHDSRDIQHITQSTYCQLYQMNETVLNSNADI